MAAAMVTAINLFVILLLVFLNGFFVAAEFAFVSVRRQRIEAQAKAGDRRAQRLVTILGDMNAYLSAAQLGITLASLALGWLGEPTVAHMLEGPLAGTALDPWRHVIAFFVGFAVVTSLHIVLGEQAPKLLGLERAERVALASAGPMQLFYRVFRLPIIALDRASARTVRLLGLDAGSAGHGAIYTKQDVQQIIDASQQGGHIEPRAGQLLKGVFEFGEAEVREAMVPRTQVEALPVTATLEETRERFRTSGYSRLPVYRDRLDQIVGLLFRKDLDMGQVTPDNFDLAKLVRPPLFIPASASLGAALSQMQGDRVHFAFAIDEHGGIEGVVTLEDLLEEIVGEINDEYDGEVRAQIAREDGSYVIDGMLAVRDANPHRGLTLPEDENYTTVAGFLLARAGRLLKPGETVEYDGARFTIERVDGLRIRRLRYFPAPEPPGADAQEAAAGRDEAKAAH
jgi:CBS domain containing-hemolysin-like protein